MGVQRLADPGLVPTSQEAGGTVHSTAMAMTAPGTEPGFDGGTMTNNVSTDAPGPPAIPDRDDRWLVSADGSKPSAGQDAPFLQGGQFGQASREDAGSAWKPTPSSS